MSNNFNKVIQMGYISFGPKLDTIPTTGSPVVVFGLATNRKWKDAEGVLQKDSCFINCKAYGRTAVTIAEHFHTGKPIFITGYLKHEKWDAKDGSKRSRHIIVVQEFQFLGDRPATTESAPEEDASVPSTENEPCTEL